MKNNIKEISKIMENPYEALLKTPEEIKIMIENGKILEKYYHKKGFGFGIKYKKYILPKKFTNYRLAKKWGDWNYKGISCYKIIQFSKLNQLKK
jgi:hypothetical protein